MPLRATVALTALVALLAISACSAAPARSQQCPTDFDSYVFTASADSKAVASAAKLLFDCGYLVLRGAMDPALLRHVHQEVVAFMGSAERSRYQTPLLGNGRDEFGLPYRKPFNARELVAEKRVLAILDQVLGARYKLEHMSVINSHPGSSSQGFHKDFPSLYSAFDRDASSLQRDLLSSVGKASRDARLPPFAVKVSIPLVDVTAQLGPTEVCPGTLPVLSTASVSRGCANPLRAVSKLGDVVFYDYQADHQGPANVGKIDRPVLDMTYTQPWFVDPARPVPSDEKWISQLKYWADWSSRPDRPGGFIGTMPALQLPKEGKGAGKAGAARKGRKGAAAAAHKEL